MEKFKYYAELAWIWAKEKVMSAPSVFALGCVAGYIGARLIDKM